MRNFDSEKFVKINVNKRKRHFRWMVTLIYLEDKSKHIYIRQINDKKLKIIKYLLENQKVR